MSITPKASWPWVRTLLHSVYDQPDADSVVAQGQDGADEADEQHDDWIEGRRYLGLDVLARSRQTRTNSVATPAPPASQEALSA